MSEENDEKTTEQQLEDMRKALEKANGEAATYRHEAKEAKEQLETVSPYRDKYLQAQVENKLLARGVKNPERLVGLVDVSDVESDEDLDGKVEALTESLPEVFDPKARAGKIDAAESGEPKPATTATDKLTAQLMNR